MIVRFNKPKSFFFEWAIGGLDRLSLVENLEWRELGSLTIISGSAHYMMPYLMALSSTFDLDEIIQDPFIQ